MLRIQIHHFQENSLLKNIIFLLSYQSVKFFLIINRSGRTKERKFVGQSLAEYFRKYSSNTVNEFRKSSLSKKRNLS